MIRQWEKELQELTKKKIKVVLITDDVIEIEGSILYLYGNLKYVDKDSDFDKVSQLRLILDSEYVLTGEISGKDSDTCLYCGQRNFVNVFKEALRNEIKLIELTEERDRSKVEEKADRRERK